MLGLILKVLQEIIDIATGVDFEQGRIIVLLWKYLVKPIAVKDLNEFGIDGTLIKQALNRHLDLELR